MTQSRAAPAEPRADPLLDPVARDAPRAQLHRPVVRGRQGGATVRAARPHPARAADARVRVRHRPRAPRALRQR